MDKLFCALKERMDQGKGTMLITIAEASGSIPRAAGAFMLTGPEGWICGTIGGGRLEYLAICEGKALLQERTGACREYGLNASEAADTGMVCGGRAKVLFYYVDPEKQSDCEFVRCGVRLCEACIPCRIMLPLYAVNTDEDADKKETANAKMKELSGREAEQNDQFQPDVFFYDLYVDGRVYVFGGGHLAQEVVPVLSHLGFYCVVIEDREEFARPELFPGAREVLLLDFSELEEHLTISERDYIAVMTRGHQSDLEVEEFALKTPAKYIGVVGSRKKRDYVRRKLLERGVTEKELDRVITPIGLAIKAETAAEIAISIAAQLIMKRAEVF